MLWRPRSLPWFRCGKHLLDWTFQSRLRRFRRRWSRFLRVKICLTLSPRVLVEQRIKGVKKLPKSSENRFSWNLFFKSFHFKDFFEFCPQVKSFWHFILSFCSSQDTYPISLQKVFRTHLRLGVTNSKLFKISLNSKWPQSHDWQFWTKLVSSREVFEHNTQTPGLRVCMIDSTGRCNMLEQCEPCRNSQRGCSQNFEGLSRLS